MITHLNINALLIGPRRIFANLPCNLSQGDICGNDLKLFHEYVNTVCYTGGGTYTDGRKGLAGKK